MIGELAIGIIWSQFIMEYRPGSLDRLRGGVDSEGSGYYLFAFHKIKCLFSGKSQQHLFSGFWNKVTVIHHCLLNFHIRIRSQSNWPIFFFKGKSLFDPCPEINICLNCSISISRESSCESKKLKCRQRRS